MGAQISGRIFNGVSVEIEDYPYFASLGHCGAVIISDEYLLTAAHCVDNGSENPVVYVGGNTQDNSQVVYYDKVILHPNYIYLIDIPLNDIAIVHLQKPLQFSEKIQPLKLPTHGKLNGNLEKDGDSGGPLVQEDVIYGLASFGGNDCRTSTVGFYTNVLQYVSWIPDMNKRIYNGTSVGIEDYPYFASLGYCGAVIISERYLLTAAHCIEKGQVALFDQVIPHPHFIEIKGLPFNDVAIIHLRDPLQFSDKVQPLKLPTSEAVPDSELVVVGRGQDE
ncbi:unnamed protein product, partial [Leptidea sinapis]